jgi:hypothetical protein
MKVIALFGKGGIGKTTTLNLLNDLINPDNPATNLGEDDKYTFTYKGKTISITTPGDWKEHIHDNIDYAQNNNCDILVTASRTRGAGKDMLREQFKHNLLFIEKNIDYQQRDLVNKAQALDLQAIIDGLIIQLNAKEASASPTP